MTTIVGIDASMASTGLARITTNGTQWLAETSCRPSQPHGTRLADRARRIRAITTDVLHYAQHCDLAVIEAPQYGGKVNVGHAVERAWLWGSIVSRLLDHELPVLDVPPRTRALFATAHGGADKAAVALAMGRMWPDWTPADNKGVNDQADALCLASIGIVMSDLTPPFAMPAYRIKALAKLPRLDKEDR